MTQFLLDPKWLRLEEQTVAGPRRKIGVFYGIDKMAVVKFERALDDLYRACCEYPDLRRRMPAKGLRGEAEEVPMKISQDPEMSAMRRVSNALDTLSREAKARVLQWAYDKYVATVNGSGEPVGEDRVTAHERAAAASVSRAR